MTVSTTTLKATFSGNDSTTVFAYSWKIFADTELTVIVRTTATGTESVRAIGTGSTNYAVSGVGETSGGNVTFVTAPASTETVLILRNTGLTQGTDYQPADPFPAASHEDALDKLTHIVQELDEELGRSFKVSRSVTDLTTPEFTDAAATRASKVLGFDSTGANLEAQQELGEYQGNWAASTDYGLRDIVKDTDNNSIYICVTAHTSSGSVPLSTNTDSAKWSLIVDAASATTSAASAATSATAAATSATAAATSATAAATSATAAASSATGAASSASTATTQASNASTSASAASASEAAASASETDAASAASAVGLQFTFDSSTTMADPGTGDFRLNHATVASVSAIALDATSADTGNPDVSDFVATWDDSTSTLNGHLILKKKGTPATFAIYTVGAVTDNTGWLQLALTHVDSAGSWSAADVGYLQFIRLGDKGDTGSTGSTGSTGATGNSAGLLMAFETTTTDTDQGAGKVWLNHGTPSSATVVYMDDVEAGGASINALVDTWDDSTTTALRGTISIYKNSAPENFHIFNVTGAVTSASTYSKIASTFVQSAGTISDGDAVSVQFQRSGDTGAAGAGSGDLLAANNLSDVDTAATALSNIGGIGAATTDTLTNKTFDANGTGNSLSNVDVADLATGTDGELITWDASGNPATVAVGLATEVLTSNGAGAAPTFQAAGGGGGGLTSVQVFTSSGTWTKPTDIATVRVQLVGSGATAKQNRRGGGAGGYSEKLIDVSSISSETVTVGASAAASNAGNTSSFGSHCSATGGALGGAGAGGLGGVGTGGDINIYGGGGGVNVAYSGGAGDGGASYFGGGQHGFWEQNDVAETLTDLAYGGGGAGSMSTYDQPDNSVGGLVVVWEYK